MKFALGDIVKYTNKRDKVNALGEVIAIQSSEYGPPYYIVEPISGEPGKYLYNFDCSKLSKDVTVNPNKFIERGLGNSFLRSKNKILYVPSRSKNLTSGILQYDPSQQGEDDDSV